MNVVNELKLRLERVLNKPANENLVHALVKFYLTNSLPAAFSSYLQVLGVKADTDRQYLYQTINDNIGVLDRLARADPSTNVQKNEESAKKKKRVLQFGFDDDLADNEDIAAHNTRKTPHNNADINPEPKPKKLLFKKINKAKALALKKESLLDLNGPVLAELPFARKPALLAELARAERANEPQQLPNIDTNDTPDTPETWEDDAGVFSDVEQDREWYTAEEFGHVAQDFDAYDDLSSNGAGFKPVSAVGSNHKSKTSNNNKNATGGLYDQDGNYVDHDHAAENASDLSRIPLVSHFMVPPFLEGVQEHLSMIELGNPTASRTIGPTVDPVKEPLSELAVAAREGSVLVRERKARREKAKQAKERSGISGTTMGNVLGVSKEEKEGEKDEDTDDPLLDGPDSSERPQTLLEAQRRFLPVFSVRNQLVQVIADNQVVIVVGETGSGKTTQLTQYLHEEKFTARGAIGCTQPRRVAAMSVAKRVSEEVGCRLGSKVGYSIRFEDRTSKDTLIKYMTEGILLREIIGDPSLSRYLCIIMDEAHERSLNTDILLGLFKNTVLARRRDLKLIITSATMNADRFSHFFGGAPQFSIPGRTYPVDVLYSRMGSTDYVETAAKQVLSIHLLRWLESGRANDGDILVFMTGQEDIEATSECIQEKLDMLDSPPPLDVYPIYSTMPADLQAKIFRRTNPRRRKCIIATNIAETSLTIDGIKYVIDSGLTKVKVYNAKLGMDTLQVVPVSLANAQQRSGRAGRTGPGQAFRLYTERATSELQMYTQPIPEVQRTNLSNVALMLKSFSTASSKMSITEFPFLDPPPQDLLSCSLYELWSIGAIDNLGDMTPLGRAMNSFPMEPNLAKLMLFLTKPAFSCLYEIIVIVSMLSVPLCYYRPKERAAEADAARDKFLILESDHLTLLNIYRQWEAVPKHKQDAWCTRNFFHGRSLHKAKDIKNQLTLIMQQNRLPVARSASDESIVKCICAAFFHQLAKLLKSSSSTGGAPEYLNLRHTFMKMYLHPTSALNGGATASALYVVYHELILTNKEYMSCVTTVDPLWLLEYGLVFYGVLKPTELKILKETGLQVPTKDDFEAQLKDDQVRFRELELRAKMKRKTPRASAIHPDGTHTRRGF